ncbi:MAG: hypothetical protein QF479_02490 [Candidatus Poseidoniaceae archaeon]|nr:hypothetical protein [Candidatus Poseidoniaceae archaeon]
MGKVQTQFSILISVLILSGFSGCISDEVIFGDNDNPGIPGGLTMACLDSSKYTKLVFEIDYESGYQPKSSSTDLLKQRIEEVCDKPDGVTFTFTETVFGNQGTWTDDDVRSYGWEFKENQPQDSSTLHWQIIFPSGTYSDDSVLGVAVDASTIAIFGDSVEEAKGPIFGRPSAEEVENSVIVHEVGHLLGLVNIVYNSLEEHEDPEHPNHSSNDDSVMYWAIDSTSIGSIFSGELPDEFDQYDLQDLNDMKTGKIDVYNQLWTP